MLLSTDDFAAVDGFRWIFKAIADPTIHPQIQITETENQRLVTLRVFKCPPCEFKTFLDISGNENDVVGITVARLAQQIQVALLGPGRHASRGPDALDVEQDGGNFSKVAVAEEFIH